MCTCVVVVRAKLQSHATKSTISSVRQLDCRRCAHQQQQHMQIHNPLVSDLRLLIRIADVKAQRECGCEWKGCWWFQVVGKKQRQQITHAAQSLYTLGAMCLGLRYQTCIDDGIAIEL